MLPLFLVGCENQISKTKFQGKLNFICSDNNSLSFSEEVNPEKFPQKMILNTTTHELCERAGNILIYRSDKCGENSSVARFDYILGELTLNNPPREIVMKCVAK